MGQQLDAAAWDLSHGGNVRSREAALSYFKPNGASYIAGQTGQTVAAINYMRSIITNVLAKTDPAVNYATTNGIASPITQQKLSAYDQNPGTETIVDNLIKKRSFLF